VAINQGRPPKVAGHAFLFEHVQDFGDEVLSFPTD
jgi:hypothetical protein